jgi:hypothetical protein
MAARSCENSRLASQRALRASEAVPGYYRSSLAGLDRGLFQPSRVGMLRIRVLSKNKMFLGRGFVKMSFFAIEMADRIG